MQRRFEGRTVCCIGTGPSLTLEQIQAARRKDFVLVGCNRVYEIVPDLAVLWGTNYAFWAYYESARMYPASKWTVNDQARDEFGLNWIAEKNAPGLSTDPEVIHHGHGGGFSQMNLAYLMGAERIVLLGYDLKYAADYDGRERKVGSSPRHFFGEYPPEMQHWPSKRVKAGVHEELVGLYESVAAQGAIEIVNCTPGSALQCFPQVPIERL